MKIPSAHDDVTYVILIATVFALLTLLWAYLWIPPR